jgi:hypothetical protein
MMQARSKTLQFVFFVHVFELWRYKQQKLGSIKLKHEFLPAFGCFILGLLFFFTFPAIDAFAGSVTLAWDPNTESDLAGYNLYYGTNPGIYGSPINAGKVTQYSVSGLLENTTYYFSLTAYDTSGNESAPSNEMSRKIETSSSVPPPPTTSNNYPGELIGGNQNNLVLQHNVSGEVTLWLMDGFTIISRGIVAPVSAPEWKIQGLGDFNGDGKADLAWHHNVSGKVVLWLMDGLNLAQSGIVNQDTN